MRPFRVLEVIAGVLVLVLMSGCFWAPDLDRVRKDIEQQIPGATFKKEVALSLGPVTLGVARAVVRLAPDAHEAAAYLKDLHDVTVAVYEAQNIAQVPQIRLPKDLKKLTANGEWELALKAADDGEFVWIFCKTEDGTVKGLYVVVLDSDNLVLVRARGRIENILRKAMSEHLNLADNG
jgi:hypothetical protein